MPRCIRNYAQAITRENQRSNKSEQRNTTKANASWKRKAVEEYEKRLGHQKNKNKNKNNKKKYGMLRLLKVKFKAASQQSNADNEDFPKRRSVCSCGRLVTISWLLEAARGCCVLHVLTFEWLLHYKYCCNNTNTTQHCSLTTQLIQQWRMSDNLKLQLPRSSGWTVASKFQQQFSEIVWVRTPSVCKQKYAAHTRTHLHPTGWPFV